MNELQSQDPVINAHEFLKAFLNKFETAKRGGIHDFMEITVFNMINLAIGEVDKYLSQGHKEVNANNVMMIVTDSYQKVLDNIKRNLEDLKDVRMR
jgi:hypothetical protein